MTDLPARVLVVDDLGTSRLKMSMAVRALGHEVETASDGIEALHYLESEEFDIILLDIEMPNLDGYGVLREMRNSSNLTDVPTIVISAIDDLESVCEAIKLGAADYLPKDFNPTLLRARMSACLEKKRWRDQEIAYLQDVSKLTLAAAALENDQQEDAAKNLSEVQERNDALGNLARVFSKMADEFHRREAALKNAVRNLQIRIDNDRLDEKVTQITGTSYFKDLRTRAKDLREEMQMNSSADSEM